MGQRDTLQTKTYKQENKFWAENPIEWLSTIEECNEFVNKLAAKLGYKKTVKVTENSRMSSTLGWAYHDQAMIEIQSGHFSPWLLMHEFGHNLHGQRMRDEVNFSHRCEIEAHGPSYLRTYIDIVKAYDNDLGVAFDNYWFGLKREVLTCEEEVEKAVAYRDTGCAIKIQDWVKYFIPKEMDIQYNKPSRTIEIEKASGFVMHIRSKDIKEVVEVKRSKKTNLHIVLIDIMGIEHTIDIDIAEVKVVAFRNSRNYRDRTVTYTPTAQSYTYKEFANA
jgi:uncharacterized protein YqkB